MLLYTQTIEDPRQTRQFEDIYTACRGRLLALARRKLCGGAEAAQIDTQGIKVSPPRTA